MRLTFTGTNDFEACRRGENWCEERGISVGAMQRGDPRGLLLGEFQIQKWRCLDAIERAALHGTMSGNMRSGPVYVDLKPEIAQRVRA